jgi:hypothetical protein
VGKGKMIFMEEDNTNRVAWHEGQIWKDFASESRQRIGIGISVGDYNWVGYCTIFHEESYRTKWQWVFY